MCERELETEQNCNILTPTLLAITAFFPRSPRLLNRGPEGPLCWVLVFSTASYLQFDWSPTDWISCALSYIIVQLPPSSCGRHNFALIQPVHGQVYSILIDRMHLLFTPVHFLFWQSGRLGGQYTTEFVSYNYRIFLVNISIVKWGPVLPFGFNCLFFLFRRRLWCIFAEIILRSGV